MLKKNRTSIDFSIDEAAHQGILKFKGALTEKGVEELRETIKQSLGKVSYFKLNLEDVTAVDLSSIQSLYSTCESFGRSNMVIDGICPVIFTSAVENTGFSYHNWLCFGR